MLYQCNLNDQDNQQKGRSIAMRAPQFDFFKILAGESPTVLRIVAAVCLILGLSAGGASAQELVDITAEPEVISSLDPVTLTVSGLTRCPVFSEPEVGFRVTIRWRNRCPDPGPLAPFEARFTVGPFPGGSLLRARVVDEDRAPVAETRIAVRPDAIAVELLGEDGEPFEGFFLNTLEAFTIRIRGVDECPRLGRIDRSRRAGELGGVENVVRIEVETGCRLSPPLPREFFEFLVPAGPLRRGALDLRLVDGTGVQILRSRLGVSLERPTLSFLPAAPSAGDVVTATVALPGGDRCPPLRDVTVEGHFIRIEYDEACILPTSPRRPFQTLFEATFGPLEEAPYEIEVRDTAGRIAHAERLVVLGPGRCVDTEDSLCLAGDRFEVKASWRTAGGDSGHGKAVPETDGSGLFYFFGRDNPELLVKVLDACEAFGRYWFFASGLTDVEVELEVTDRETAARRTYSNPLGLQFMPVLDTQAFATCP